MQLWWKWHLTNLLLTLWLSSYFQAISNHHHVSYKICLVPCPGFDAYRPFPVPGSTIPPQAQANCINLAAHALRAMPFWILKMKKAQRLRFSIYLPSLTALCWPPPVLPVLYFPVTMEPHVITKNCKRSMLASSYSSHTKKLKLRKTRRRDALGKVCSRRPSSRTSFYAEFAAPDRATHESVGYNNWWKLP